MMTRLGLRDPERLLDHRDRTVTFDFAVDKVVQPVNHQEGVPPVLVVEVGATEDLGS